MVGTFKILNFLADKVIHKKAKVTSFLESIKVVGQKGPFPADIEKEKKKNRNAFIFFYATRTPERNNEKPTLVYYFISKSIIKLVI